MRIIPEDQRESTERDYLAWFLAELRKITQDKNLEELQNDKSISVGLEFMDFAVLSFRETGRIDDLKQVTRYTLEKGREGALSIHHKKHLRVAE